MANTDPVRSNRERWFRTVPGARDAYLTDPQIRTTVDSVDAALSMVDRAMTAEGLAEETRARVLDAAVFGRPEDLGEVYRERSRTNRLAAVVTPGTVHGTRPHMGRPEDDELRKRAAEMPPPEARCHYSVPHFPHRWSGGDLTLYRCPGIED